MCLVYENIAGNKDRRAEALFHSLLLSFQTLKKWAESTYFFTNVKDEKIPYALSLSEVPFLLFLSRNKLLVSLSPVELRERCYGKNCNEVMPAMIRLN